MKYYLTTFAITLIHSFNFSQAYYLSTAINLPSSNTTYSINYPGCDAEALFTCPPTVDINQGYLTSYYDMAVDASAFYYINGNTGNLYSQSITGSPSCQYIGNFGNSSINALVADTAGILYAAGIQNQINVSSLFRFQSGTVTVIGNFPSNIFSIGDLFFYEHRLFMLAGDTNQGGGWIVEVDMVNPSQSCIYMPLPSWNFFGAFSIKTGSISKSFVVSCDYLAYNTYTTSIYEIDIPCKSVGNVICSYPLATSGAAAYYDMTSNNSVATCSTSMTPSLTVSGNFSICAFQTTVLSAQGAVNYTWSTSAQTSSVSVSPSTTTTYTVDGTLADNCITSSAVAIVTVTPSSLALDAPEGACKDQTLTLTGSGANSYTWSTGDNTYSIAVAPLFNTTYTLTGSEASGCINTITTSILAYPLTTISILGGESVCSGSSISFTANGATSYTWNTTEIGNSITVIPTGDISFSVNATDANGCLASSSISVSVLTLPTLSVIGIFSICPGDATILSANGAVTYTWNTNETTASIRVNPNLNTIYVVKGTAENNCISTATTQVMMKPKPQLVLSNDVAVAPGQSATLSVTGGLSYLWDAQSNMSCKTCPNPIVSPEITTRYCVLATGEYCKTEACVNVEVTCEKSNFFIPSAFSPNGDGINDKFCLEGWNNCIQKFSLSVFNRWGEKVYGSESPLFCWDGFFEGQAMNTQVFVYVASLRFANGREEIKKGTLTLMH